ncbi:sigma factor, partial [Amycolatopsis sp. NPDC000673]|uniref:sigma factor n=1 Tax=Amycolatopsis sp. NPDC000673 TaxID=3154267 RepID=UPI0033184175
MVGSFHEAEDLVQETLLRAWKARDRYDAARASVRTWLFLPGNYPSLDEVTVYNGWFPALSRVMPAV